MLGWLKQFLTGSKPRQRRFHRVLQMERVEARCLSAADVAPTLGGAASLGVIGVPQVTRSESIATPTDIDMYKFRVVAGQRVGFDIDTPTNSSADLGSYLRIFDSAGSELRSNNDRLAPGDPKPGPGSGPEGFDAYIEYTFSRAGVYYVGVSNWQNFNYNSKTGATTLGSDSRYLTGSYVLVVANARLVATPYRSWTVSTGLDTFPLHDYHVEFRIPASASRWAVYGMTPAAQATLTTTRGIPGGLVQSLSTDGKTRIIHLTAGLEARLAGGYFAYSAAGWANDLRVVYLP